MENFIYLNVNEVCVGGGGGGGGGGGAGGAGTEQNFEPI